MARDLSKNRIQPILRETSRITAALAGTLPPTFLASLCAARYLPVELDTRFAIGLGLIIPLWVAAMCLAFAAKKTWRVWAVCVALTLLLAALANLS
jgi:hypothetical protein